MKISRLLKAFLLIVLVISVLSGFAYYIFGILPVHKELRDKKKLAELEWQKYISQYIGDIDWAKNRHPEFFQFGSYERNAGEWINDKIHWKFFQAYYSPELRLPSEVIELFDGKEVHDFNYSMLTRISGLLPSADWMDELRVFDYWDLTSSGPFAEYLNRHTYRPFNHPIPNYEELRIWSMIRLFQGLLSQDLSMAIHTVKHFATLLLTTERLEANLLAAQIIGMITSMSENESHKENYRRLERLTYATPEVFSPLLKSHALYRRDLLHQGQFGKISCAGLVEAIDQSVIFRPFLEILIPDHFELLDHLIKNGPCRLSHLREIWNEEDYIVSALSEMGFFKDIAVVERFLEEGTLLNRVLGGVISRNIGVVVLLSISTSNYWKHYASQ